MFKLKLHTLIFILISQSAVSQTLVKDIYTGKNGSNPSIIGSVNGGYIFYATTPTEGNEIWFTDGTGSNTKLVKDINSGVGSSSFNSQYVKVNNNWFFVAKHQGLNWSLWKTDGTTAGTLMVKDLGGIPIPPGGGSVAPILMAAHNGLLYFGFDDQGGGLGNELWVSDGTTSGTKMVKDINPTVGSTPIGLTSMGKYLYFYANDGSKGYELWRSNGTDTGTSMVADIYPGPIGSYPTGYPSIFVFKNKLYFGAQGTHDEGIELYESDGTGAGTKLVKDINPNMTGSYPAFLAATSNYLIFRANDGTNGLELWITDGTSNGTKLLKDINAGVTGSTPYNANVVGSKVVFSAADASHGTEPWVTDGTTAGTTLLKDIFTGKGSSYAGAPIQLNGIFYFYADDSIHGIELWQTDGTPNGTLLNTDLNKGKSGSIVGSIISNGSSLMFSCKIDKDSLGQELYIFKPVNKASISKNTATNNEIRVYPNPVIQGQKLTFQIDGNSPIEIAISSMDGRLTSSFTSFDKTIIIPESIGKGLYVLSIRNNSGFQNFKIQIE